MLRNIIGPVFDFNLLFFFVVYFCFFFFKYPLLSAGRMRFSKIKKKKKKKLDQFLTLKRAKIGPVFDFTAYIYICCRRGIWSPQGGDLVPSTDQIPSPAVSPENALRNRKHFTETTIFIVFSCFFGPFFGDAPKTRKNHHAESATIRGRF